MSDKIKKGDIVCHVKSLGLLYKTYYIVKEVNNDVIMHSRCPLFNIPTYVYKSPTIDLVYMKRCTLELSNYIIDQLKIHAQDILDEETFSIYVKKTVASTSLLYEDFAVLSLRAEDGRQLMFEIKGIKEITKSKWYKTSLNIVTNKYINIQLGRMFCML